MRPTLFEIASVRIHAYPALVGFAFVLCTMLVLRESCRQGLALPPTTPLWAFFGALLGARLLYTIEFAQPLWRSLILWENGIIYYGGLFGGTIAVVSLLTLRRVSVLRAAGLIAPYLALGEAIGRIGCFLNGCCWGRPSSLPWAVRFPAGSLAHAQQTQDGLLQASSAASLPVHPTQLYIAVSLLAVFAALRLAQKRNLPGGFVALAYLALYAIVRFGMEVFRADSARFLFHMTIAQWMCLVILTLSLLLAVWARKRPHSA